MNNNFFTAKEGDLIIGRMSNGVSMPNNKYGVILRDDLFFDAIPNKYCWFYPYSTSDPNTELYFYDKEDMKPYRIAKRQFVMGYVNRVLHKLHLK